MKKLVDGIKTGPKSNVAELHVSLSHNLCSCVSVTGSLQPRSEWPGGIFENSDYFKILIFPDPKCQKVADDYAGNVEIRLVSCWGVKKIRQAQGLSQEQTIKRVVSYLQSL